MPHLALNLLAWREAQARQKILHDSLHSLFLTGVLALIIEAALYLMQLYVAERVQQIQHIHHTLQTTAQALHQALSAKQTLLQTQKNLLEQKNNQILWQKLFQQLNTLYPIPPAISLNKLSWQDEHWRIEGFAENNASLIHYQKNLQEKNLALDVTAWQPNHTDHDMSNFELSG